VHSSRSLSLSAPIHHPPLSAYASTALHNTKKSLVFPANRFTLTVADPLYDVLQFTVVKKGFVSSSALGAVLLPVFLVTARPNPPSRVVQWWPLRKSANDRSERGAVLLDVSFNAPGNTRPPAISLVPQLKLPLSVRVLEAVNVVTGEANGVADLHAVVGFGHGKSFKEQTTETRRKTQFPVFNELFTFLCTDVSEAVRLHMFADGKQIGQVVVPVSIMLVALLSSKEKGAMALDFWWPLLERRALIQPQNRKPLGLAHLVIYVGGSSAQMHQATEEPVQELKSGVGKKSNTKDAWDKRVLVLRKGGKLPPRLSVYKSESDAKNDANGTLIFLLGARFPDKVDAVKKHAGRVLCVRECIAKDTKPRTFLFDTVAECDAWRAALVAARKIPSNWFDARLTGSAENKPMFVSIQEAVRGVEAIGLPYLSVADENDESDFKFGTSAFIVAARGAPVGAEIDGEPDYGHALLADDEADDNASSRSTEYGSTSDGGSGYGSVPPAAGEYGAAPPPASSGEYGAAPPPTSGGEYGSAPPAVNSGYGTVPSAVSGYGTVPSGYGPAPPLSGDNSSRNQLPSSGAYASVTLDKNGYSAPPSELRNAGYGQAPPEVKHAGYSAPPSEVARGYDKAPPPQALEKKSKKK
jgi:hypothetical protein